MMRTKSDECRVSSVETVERHGDLSRHLSLATRHSGFTLIELVIVMAMAALLAGITISSSGRMTANNRAQTCMMNLRHLHQAMMMYRVDYDAYPAFLYPNPDASNDVARLGLWGLHSYDGTPATEAPYLKSFKRFKCPHDDQRTNDATVTWPSPQAPSPTSPPFLLLPPSPTPNPFTGFAANYNSYQTIDPDDSEATYQPYRGVADPSDKNYLRQILPPSCVFDPGSQYQGMGGCPAGYSPRFVVGTAPCAVSGPQCVVENTASRFAGVGGAGPSQRLASLGMSMQKWEPRGDTVVTWCVFHRDKTQPRKYDIVLFLDGSVQLVPSHRAAVPAYQVDASCPDCTNGAGVGQGCLQINAGVRTYTPQANLLWQRCHKKAGT